MVSRAGLQSAYMPKLLFVVVHRNHSCNTVTRRDGEPVHTVVEAVYERGFCLWPLNRRGKESKRDVQFYMDTHISNLKDRFYVARALGKKQGTGKLGSVLVPIDVVQSWTSFK